MFVNTRSSSFLYDYVVRATTNLVNGKAFQITKRRLTENASQSSGDDEYVVMRQEHFLRPIAVLLFRVRATDSLASCLHTEGRCAAKVAERVKILTDWARMLKIQC